MASAVTMPQMGYDMTEGAIQNWIKHEGDEVKKGEIIAEIETDKATIELEAFNGGVLRKIVVEPGEIVPINTVIAVIGDRDEKIDWASFGIEGGDSDNVKATPAQAALEVTEPPAAPVSQEPAKAEVAVAKDEARATAQPAAPAAASAAPTTSGQSLFVAQARPTSNGNGASATSNGASNGNGVGEYGRVLSSPFARTTATELGVDIAQVPGTGPEGRRVGRDVQNYAANIVDVAAQPITTPAAQPASAIAPVPAPAAQQPEAATAAANPNIAYTEVDLSRMRQTIARRMTEAKTQVPHFYVTNEIDMGEAVKLRQTINATIEKDGGAKVSVNDMIIKAVAKALKKYPAINSSFQGTKLRLNTSVNIAFAVALENGLVTPVVFDADKKSIGQIAAEAKALAEKARTGSLKPDEFSGGTFTVSNLGMFDVSEFVAIINQPQAAILAVGATKPKVVVKSGSEEEGNLEFGVINAMNVTISADHRATDGAVAAQFLQELKRVLQNPLSLLV